MIIKEYFDRFAKEKMDEYIGELKAEDAVCMKRALDRLAWCNPVDEDLVALLAPYRPGLDRKVVKKLIFLPREVVYEFTEILAMEELESINFEEKYYTALVCASQFRPVIYGFQDLYLAVILGAEFVGPAEELADVFLDELARRVKNNRRVLDTLQMKPADIPCKKTKYYTDKMQMRIVREVFLFNQLQLYVTIRGIAEAKKTPL